MASKITDRIAAYMEDFPREEGISLYHCEFVKEGPDRYLRVYIDVDEEGRYVSTDDCEKVSKFLDEKLTEWFRNLPAQAKRHNWTLHIEKIVLGELKGLSNNENKERAGNARMGMSRMENLLELQGRRVRFEDNAIRGKDTIADSVLLRVAAKTPHAIIITNDRELRILAKSQGITAIGSAKF